MRTLILTAIALIVAIPLCFAQNPGAGSVPVGTGIGQVPESKEVTRLGENSLLAEYMPFDKGNVWTYSISKDGSAKEHTQRVVSESGGWSVFDSYFGKEGASLRIAPGGDLLVTSGGVVSSFYTDEVTRSFPEEPVSTAAGEFQDAMVVTMPKGGEFWFRDVYVKGVGLVYHERKSTKGSTSYTLKSANVGGSHYPPK